MNKVIGLQLVSGQDIIGEVEGLQDESCPHIVIHKPAAIGMMGGQQGQMNVGLIPWIPFSENEEFVIQKRNLLVTYTPNNDLLNHYNRLFGSGIIVAKHTLM